ncbi:MAG: hypothetical protein P9L94_19025 [Candidatus Hinthialibacter antarcticus]|nr:hypothetical protein [Candidatus Hinthialibacter antarcticus]
MNHAAPQTRQSPQAVSAIAAALIVLLVLAFFYRNEFLGPLLHLRGWIAGLLPLLMFWGTAERIIQRLAPNDGSNERILYTAFLSFALASLLGFILLTLRIGNPIVFLTLSAIAIVLDRRAWAQRFTAWMLLVRNAEASSKKLWLAIGAALLLLAVAASLPPLWYDTHEYHLYAPEQFLRTGGWVAFSSNVYCAFPMNVEMLFLWPLAVGSSVGCKVVLFAFCLIGAGATASLAKRWGAGRSAAWSALILLATGLLLRVLMQGKLDAALVGSTAVLLLAYERYREKANSLDGLMIAAAMGFALGAKYVSALSIAAPFAAMVFIDALASKQWRRCNAFGWCAAGAAVWCAPWLVRNAFLYENPVYPLLTPMLGGTPPIFADLFQAAHAPTSAPLAQQALDFFWLPLKKSLLESMPIGFSPLWLAALPLMFTKPRNSGLAHGAAFCVVAYMGWFFLTQRNDRFLAPLLPLLAIFPVFVIAQCGQCRTQRTLKILFSFFIVMQLWLGARVVVNSQSVGYLSSPTLEEIYFSERMPHYRAIDWLNQQRQKNPAQVGGVLFVGEAQAYGAKFTAIAPTVFNHHPLANGNLSNITHILYNRSELSRLTKGYGPLGWRLGPVLQQRMDELIQSGKIEAVYSDPDYPDVIKIFRVNP